MFNRETIKQVWEGSRFLSDVNESPRTNMKEL